MRITIKSFLLLLCCTSWLQAQTVDPRISEFAKSLKTADANFEQSSVDVNGKLGQSSTGQLALKAPRQFRWHVKAPYEQLIIADGDHVWIYDPELEQVSVRVQSYEEQTSPLAVLIDPDSLYRQYKVTKENSKNGIDWLLLTLIKTEDAQIARARLGFSGSQLQQMQIEDQLGQQTNIRFSQWRRNPVLAASLFSFTPPEGVDVIGETRDLAEVIPLSE